VDSHGREHGVNSGITASNLRRNAAVRRLRRTFACAEDRGRSVGSRQNVVRQVVAADAGGFDH
jgi:hypothetical protein